MEGVADMIDLEYFKPSVIVHGIRGEHCVKASRKNSGLS